MKEHGELFIDHRASPGIGLKEVEHFKKLGINVPFVPEGTELTLPTMCCSHCRSHTVKNPLRTRERGHCHHCFKYLCDPCATKYKLTNICRSAEEKVDIILGSDKPNSFLLRS